MSLKKIERYEIKEELDRGGMANVFIAYDPLFRREVAIKVIPREWLHKPEFRQRFNREAKIIANLEIQSVVPVYDFGEYKGQPFLVMRYMQGGSLDERIKAAPLPFSETVQIIRKLAPALDEAHRQGIVHRDLKPKNILFDTREGVYLTDFGIAKILDNVVSSTGDAIIGTPYYMSPEQASGHKIDHHSDIYSLGVVLYEMLTGIQPYKANTPMGTAVMHILEPVPRILEQKPDLPLAVDDVIVKAMAKNPADRYNSAHEMFVALGSILDNQKRDEATLVSSAVVEDKTVISPAEQEVEVEETNAISEIDVPESIEGSLKLGEDSLHTQQKMEVEPRDERPPARTDVPEKDDLLFTVYSPVILRCATWYKFLVYVHLPSVTRIIEQDSRNLLGGGVHDYRKTFDVPDALIAPGSEITIIPEIRGCAFDPPSAKIIWKGAWQRARFQVQARIARSQPAFGYVNFRLGITQIAEVSVYFHVLENHREIVSSPSTQHLNHTGSIFRKIFASYSRKDSEIVDHLERVYTALGDEYLRDIESLRSGEEWEPALLDMIDSADIFQLYWSENARQSQHVTKEWRYALARKIPRFVRPFYWQKPMTAPPQELGKYHFAHLDLSGLEGPDRN